MLSSDGVKIIKIQTRFLSGCDSLCRGRILKEPLKEFYYQREDIAYNGNMKHLSSPSKRAEPASCPPTLHTTTQRYQEKQVFLARADSQPEVSQPNDALSGSGA